MFIWVGIDGVRFILIQYSVSQQTVLPTNSLKIHFQESHGTVAQILIPNQMMTINHKLIHIHPIYILKNSDNETR